MLRLPPRLLEGRVQRVSALGELDVLLDLGFGSHVRRYVRIEGWPGEQIPTALRNAAMHALIVLVGGKSVLVLVSASSEVSPAVLGRVYLMDKVSRPDPSWFVPPYGTETPMLEVACFMSWVARYNFDKGTVLAALNGPGG